jgi:hypothetical protein
MWRDRISDGTPQIIDDAIRISVEGIAGLKNGARE